MNILSSWYLLVIPSIVLLHLVVAPYTKVEESFNMQAIHDILKHGVPVGDSLRKFTSFFDHMSFPGAVPRTFIGALVVAGISKPFIWLGELHGLAAQMTVRAVLGLLNGAALVTYTRSIRRAYGERTALWYTFFQASQFHVLYYASRTLPNTFAFCLSTFALSSFLPNPAAPLLHAKRLRLGFYLLTLATVIFRSEVALLMVSQAGLEIFRSGSINNAYNLVQRALLPAVSIAAIVGIIFTVSVDTYFWQSKTLLWPELSAFWFNVFPKEHEGASAWGTSPWHWYFTSAIPRLFLGPSILLIPYGLLFTTQRAPVLTNILPPLGYTVLYSILPHKETRFLFPIVPSLTLAAAIPASYLSLRRDFVSKLSTLALALSTTLSFLATHAVLLPLSAQCYPGAHALQALHTFHDAHHPSNHTPVHVHLTNLALQTGTTHFLEHPDWQYDRTASPAAFLDPTFWSRFQYVVVEDPARVIGAWRILAEIPALRRASPHLVRDSSGELLVFRPNATQGLCRGWRDGQEEEEEGCVVAADALVHLVRAMYGDVGARVYGVLHDVLRRGYGVRGQRGKGVTAGYWVDWGMETRLYVLGRDETGVSPNVE